VPIKSGKSRTKTPANVKSHPMTWTSWVKVTKTSQCDRFQKKGTPDVTTIQLSTKVWKLMVQVLQSWKWETVHTYTYAWEIRRNTLQERIKAKMFYIREFLTRMCEPLGVHVSTSQSCSMLVEVNICAKSSLIECSFFECGCMVIYCFLSQCNNICDITMSLRS